MVGGGTVAYVNPDEHVYLDDPVHREEGGTPAIVEAIRAGLVFQLKQAVGAEVIRAHEEDFLRRAVAAWAEHPRIEVLGNLEAERLSIVSFVLRAPSGRFLHHNLVVALLNDLFGIQSRGGCSCAGPYGHRLLGIDLARSHEFEREITHGCEGIKPGWVRVNFNYFISEAVFRYIVEAVALVADHGWALIDDYAFDPATGRWRHHAGPIEPPLRLAMLRYDANGRLTYPHTREAAPEAALDGYLAAGPRPAARAGRGRRGRGRARRAPARGQRRLRGAALVRPARRQPALSACQPERRLSPGSLVAAAHRISGRSDEPRKADHPASPPGSGPRFRNCTYAAATNRWRDSNDHTIPPATAPGPAVAAACVQPARPPGSGSRPNTPAYMSRTHCCSDPDRATRSGLAQNPARASITRTDPDDNAAVQPARPPGSGPRPKISEYSADARRAIPSGEYSNARTRPDRDTCPARNAATHPCNPPGSASRPNTSRYTCATNAWTCSGGPPAGPRGPPRECAAGSTDPRPRRRRSRRPPRRAGTCRPGGPARSPPERRRSTRGG